MEGNGKLLWILEGYCQASAKDCIGTVLNRKGGLVTVGRQDADIIIVDKSVSRRHATFQIEDEGLYLMDSQSKFGSYVNGTRVERSKACVDGDIITFGAAQLSFKITSLILSPFYYYTHDCSPHAIPGLLNSNDLETANCIIMDSVSADEKLMEIFLSNLPIFTKDFVRLLLEGHYNPSSNYLLKLPLSIDVPARNACPLRFEIVKEDWRSEHLTLLQQIIAKLEHSSPTAKTLKIVKRKDSRHSEDCILISDFFRGIRNGFNWIIAPAIVSKPIEVSTAVDKGPPMMNWCTSDVILREKRFESIDALSNFKKFRKAQPRKGIPVVIAMLGDPANRVPTEQPPLMASTPKPGPNESRASLPPLAKKKRLVKSSEDTNQNCPSQYRDKRSVASLSCTPVFGMKDLAERIQSIDSFAKTHDDFRTKTWVGGLLTILCGVLILGLVAFEFIDYQKISWRPEIVVDNTRKERMTIDFDISFPKVPCFAMTLDVMDSADQYQNNMVENITKSRLGPKGKALGAYTEEALDRPVSYCGNCYKASVTGPDGKPICCNSCSAVFAAYEHRSLPPPDMEKIDQCVQEKWPEKIKEHANEGCRVSGHFQVNKVAGNFHFAPGHSYDAYNYHLHDIRFLDGLHLDFTHQIHFLSFGEHHAEISNPLDDTVNTANAPERSFKYYSKVVAAEFRYRNGSILHTNQYAVTKNENETRGDKTAFPSVFFNYDISPMIVVYTEFKKPFSSFIVELCAIVGGVYTVSAILDAIVFHAERQIRKKISMGKTN